MLRPQNRMATRNEYRLDLSHYEPFAAKLPPTFAVRNPSLDDAALLADLMLDAYRDTIDYDGETLADARAEIDRFFSGGNDGCMLEHSWLCFEEDSLRSACLVVFWAVRNVPLVHYVMTAAEAKGQGLATVLLHRSLGGLKNAGNESVHAFITLGNIPSERLHLAAGFEHLPYYHWSTCPNTIRQQVAGFVDGCQQILGDNLLGIYLHGSLSFGSFNPNRSDIDLLVVNQALMNIESKRAIAQLLLATSEQPISMEISFLARQHLHPWQHPTPFDFHYSEDWRNKTAGELRDERWRSWQANNATVHGDIDLAGHITVINDRGITLWGAEASEVFPVVPSEDYRDSILNDVYSALENIAENPIYTILNTCRTLAWLQDGKVRSKDAGGVWALNHLPQDLQPLIQQALAEQRSWQKKSSIPYSQTLLANFASYSLAHLPARTPMAGNRDTV